MDIFFFYFLFIHCKGGNMEKYIYDGPVFEFDICVNSRWHGETMASSNKKAINNLAYQYKKQTNRTASTSINLPGKLKKRGD